MYSGNYKDPSEKSLLHVEVGHSFYLGTLVL
jgi:hypothetical protein